MSRTTTSACLRRAGDQLADPARVGARSRPGIEPPDGEDEQRALVHGRSTRGVRSSEGGVAARLRVVAVHAHRPEQILDLARRPSTACMSPGRLARDAEDLADRRLAHVEVGEDHALAAAREGHREVDRGGGLPLARDRARDGDGRRLLTRRELHERRREHRVGVAELGLVATEHDEAGPARERRDRREDGHAEDVLDVRSRSGPWCSGPRGGRRRAGRSGSRARRRGRRRGSGAGSSSSRWSASCMRTAPPGVERLHQLEAVELLAQERVRALRS